MQQQIVIGEPPLMDEIDRAFGVRGKPILFAWGATIYNPQNAYVTYALRHHEAVHGHRQGASTRTIEEWWRRYLEDKEFRLSEEIAAHRAEYQYLWRSHRDRNARSRHLQHVAEKLASPLYGGLVTLRDARRMVAS